MIKDTLRIALNGHLHKLARLLASLVLELLLVLNDQLERIFRDLPELHAFPSIYLELFLQFMNLGGFYISL